jgi:UDP-N-acetylglucosamine diphosphorylase/glucosamine-1-phosphate N-acetyltransferase
MQYILFEDESHLDLLPLTFTRPIMDLRVGALKISEKWAYHLGSQPMCMTQHHLAYRFSKPFVAEEEYMWLNAKFLPNAAYVAMLLAACAPGIALQAPSGDVLAFRSTPVRLGMTTGLVDAAAIEFSGLRLHTLTDALPSAIRYPWNIFQFNGTEIVADIAILRQTRPQGELSDPHTIVYGRDNLFIEPGVKVRAAILNAEDGPIYLGAGADIQAGSIIQGAHAICPNATVNMGAKLRGDSTIGPFCKVGGEVANSVLAGYSSKGHDGYLGNSVIGEWCNLGADTNTSNLKNNYAEVRVWNYRKRNFARTGTIFCGLIMGDHSKAGINTMFNTGTVVGVSANVFGAGYPRNFVPSFSWGGAGGLSTFALKKAYEVAEVVMGRRNVPFDVEEKDILLNVFQKTAEFRTWELYPQSNSSTNDNV